MNFFISEAMAEGAAAAAEPNALGGFIPLIVIFILFYFLLIRPQTKRAKEQKQMVASLAKGDEVVTSGGLLGRISELNENFITLEIADGVDVKIQRHAVTALLPKGTAKSS